MESLRHPVVSLRQIREGAAMTAKLILKLKGPLEHKIDCFSQRFPLFSIVCLQLVAAVSMVCAVGAIAMVGGSVIWLFYKLFGVM